MLKPILCGIGLSAVTVMLHASGTLWWIQLMRKKYILPFREMNNEQLQEAFDFRRSVWILGLTTTLLSSLLVIEVSLWALAYILIPDIDCPQGEEEAFYFSIVTFTSLGYGDIVIEGPWRIMSGMEAMVGILVFGWSSALLLTAFLKMLEIGDPSRSKSGPE